MKSIWDKNSAETKVSDLRPWLCLESGSVWDFSWNRPLAWLIAVDKIWGWNTPKSLWIVKLSWRHNGKKDYQTNNMLDCIPSVEFRINVNTIAVSALRSTRKVPSPISQKVSDLAQSQAELLSLAQLSFCLKWLSQKQSQLRPKFIN